MSGIQFVGQGDVPKSMAEIEQAIANHRNKQGIWASNKNMAEFMLAMAGLPEYDKIYWESFRKMSFEYLVYHIQVVEYFYGTRKQMPSIGKAIVSEKEYIALMNRTELTTLEEEKKKE